MPKTIRDLDAEARKHAHSERKVSMPKDFYARAGVAKKNQDEVCAQWLVFRRIIFLNEVSLDQIVKSSRQKLLFKLLTEFLQHPDAARRKQRVDALHFVHHELFESDSVITSTDKQLTTNYVATILDKLTANNYGIKKIINGEESNDFSHHNYIVKPIDKNILSSVETINAIFKQAFIHLTIMDTAENQQNDLKLILREHLLRMVYPEAQKKALLAFILQHCYDGGLFFMLYKAHKNNLAADMSFDADEDYKQATINFVTTDEATIEIYEQIPISTVAIPTDEYRSRPKKSYSHAIDIDDENSLEEKSELSNNIYLNAMETQILHTLKFDRNGAVIHKSQHAYTRVYNMEAFDLVTSGWKKQLDDVAGYAENFIANHGHIEKEINHLMGLYPQLRNESPRLDPLRIKSIFSHQQAVAYKGDQIINFFGRNCSPETLNHFYEELQHSYVRDANLFKYAIKLLRRMGEAEKIAVDLKPYAVQAGLSNPHGIGALSLTCEQTVGKLYPVLKPHELFIVYQLLPSMKFTRATVIVQQPLSLVQFDVEGQRADVLDESQLSVLFRRLNYSFLLNKDLSNNASQPGLLDLTPAHKDIFNLAISRGLDNFELKGKKIYCVDKLTTPLAYAGINPPNVFRDALVFTQQPIKLIYIDSSDKHHEILNKKGCQSLFEALNFQYYLTDLVWIDTVNSILTNLPIELLKKLDSCIKDHDGASIIDDLRYFKMPIHQEIREPGFVSFGKLGVNVAKQVDDEKKDSSKQKPSNDDSSEKRMPRICV